MIIAIDGGTTNTRLTLVDGGRVVGRIKSAVGARNAVGDSNSTLSDAVKRGITALLRQSGLTEADVRAVVLSGMIGSDSGLADIPHIVAPAGARELGEKMTRLNFPEISELPFWFIPGVKTFSDPHSHELSELDIMRGEETELVGILSQIGVGRPITAVMPGSHMKIVETDFDGRIIAFRTSVSGELSRAAAENTILSRSLCGVFPRIADSEYLNCGFDYAQTHGIGEALFKVRVQANFLGESTAEQLYAFLLGAILRDDVNSILKTGGEIIVAGSDPFRGALCNLLGRFVEVKTVGEELAENAASIGAEKIFCQNRLFS